MNAADLVDPEIKPMLELIPFEHVDAETLSMLRGPTPPCKPSDVVHLTDVTVPCELHVYPGAPHGYQLAPGSRVARQSLRDTEDWLARRLSTGDVS